MAEPNVLSRTFANRTQLPGCELDYVTIRTNGIDAFMHLVEGFNEFRQLGLRDLSIFRRERNFNFEGLILVSSHETEFETPVLGRNACLI